MVVQIRNFTMIQNCVTPFKTRFIAFHLIWAKLAYLAWDHSTTIWRHTLDDVTVSVRSLWMTPKSFLFSVFDKIDLNLLPPKPERVEKNNFQKMFFSGVKFMGDIIPNVPRDLFTYIPDPGTMTIQLQDFYTCLLLRSCLEKWTIEACIFW